MPVAPLLVAAALSWGPLENENGERIRLHDLGPVTAGYQCRYADGSKAILLRTNNHTRAVFIHRKRGYADTVVGLEFDRRGQYHFEANGGMTMYHMIELAADYLLKQPTAPLKRKTLDRFLRATNVPKCKRATFDADLYDKE